MKKIYTLIVLLALVQFGSAQFSRMPLNYPSGAFIHVPVRMSIVDANTLWVGTWKMNSWNSLLPYSNAIKSSDGGQSWQFYPIPITGNPLISDVEALNENTCYYVFLNYSAGGGQIWKTTDGGTTWERKTTTQFAGGAPDFMHIFSQDTLIAVGDPTSGYFEIQLSSDGGNTWTRVPQSDLPPLIGPLEMGSSGKCFGAIGSTIWFGTSMGRCFKSVDHGNHWSVSTIRSDTTFGGWNLCFSDLLHGIAYSTNPPPSSYYLTNDGGVTWTSMPTFHNFVYPFICRVDGINGGYIVAGKESNGSMSTSVFFTNDFFASLTKIDSGLYSYNNYVYFKDATTGWLNAFLSMNDSTIYKFNGVLTSVVDKKTISENLEIIPNPSNQNALITFPAAFLGHKKTMKIIDLSGKLIREYALKPDEQSMTLNSGLFSDGVYIIQVTSEGGSVCNNHWIISH